MILFAKEDCKIVKRIFTHLIGQYRPNYIIPANQNRLLNFTLFTSPQKLGLRSKPIGNTPGLSNRPPQVKTIYLFVSHPLFFNVFPRPVLILPPFTAKYHHGIRPSTSSAPASRNVLLRKQVCPGDNANENPV